uniref:(northern house mosquito) hypothetical protein n=1 Tax=Culex pipiens TaxID=7175 RepID=A0A8D8GH20_CULPI
MHGSLRSGHGPGAPVLRLFVAVGFGGRLRFVHCRQLLAHKYYPGRADHAGKVHQRVRVAAAGAGRGQPGRTAVGWMDLGHDGELQPVVLPGRAVYRAVRAAAVCAARDRQVQKV